MESISDNSSNLYDLEDETEVVPNGVNEWLNNQHHCSTPSTPHLQSEEIAYENESIENADRENWLKRCLDTNKWSAKCDGGEGLFNIQYIKYEQYK